VKGAHGISIAATTEHGGRPAVGMYGLVFYDCVFASDKTQLRPPWRQNTSIHCAWKQLFPFVSVVWSRRLACSVCADHCAAAASWREFTLWQGKLPSTEYWWYAKQETVVESCVVCAVDMKLLSKDMWYSTYTRQGKSAVEQQVVHAYTKK